MMEANNVDKEKWINEIGRIFLAFGSIEHVTVKMIDIFFILSDCRNHKSYRYNCFIHPQGNSIFCMNSRK